MKTLSPEVESFKTILDSTYSIKNPLAVTSVVNTVNKLIENLSLTYAQYDEVVNVTRDKLQELLGPSGLISQNL